MGYSIMFVCFSLYLFITIILKLVLLFTLIKHGLDFGSCSTFILVLVLVLRMCLCISANAGRVFDGHQMSHIMQNALYQCFHFT